MPPKAKDKGGAAPGMEEEEPDDSERELQERELVIGHLKARLGGYQDKGRELEEVNRTLLAELEAERSNLNDINEFLTKELKAQKLTSEELTQRCKELEVELVEVRQRQEEKRAEVAAAHEDKMAGLKEKVGVLETELEQLKDFETKKAQLDQQLAQLKSTLARERREQSELVDELGRLDMTEKKQIKTEMAQQVKETKAKMMKMTDNQVETTTKRTIMENEQMSAELAYASRQTERLIARNKQLLQENASAKRAVELSKETEVELAKRNSLYQDTIKDLLGKLKSQDSLKREGEDELARSCETTDDLAARLDTLGQELERHSADVEEARAEAAARQGELEASKASQDETAAFLVSCLAEVKKQIVTVVRQVEGGGDETHVMPGHLGELSADQRQRALGYLLERLHTFQSSKQHRLLGLGRPVDDHLVLPPISAAVGADPFARAGGGGAGRAVSMGVQTNDGDIISRHWREAGKTPVKGHVLAELRPWGAKAAAGLLYKAKPQRAPKAGSALPARRRAKK